MTFLRTRDIHIYMYQTQKEREEERRRESYEVEKYVGVIKLGKYRVMWLSRGELHEVELCTLNFIPRWPEIRGASCSLFVFLSVAKFSSFFFGRRILVAGMRFPATNNLPRRLLGAISRRGELLEGKSVPGAEITVKIRYRERSALETFPSRPDIDDSGTFRGFQQNSISVSRLLNDACSRMRTPLRDSPA